MPTTGGDIREVRYNHPELGSGVFYPKSNEGNTFNPGGYRTSDDVNMVSGDRQMIRQLNLELASFEVVVANDMNGRNDAVKAAELSGSPIAAEWTISLVNGTVWGMSGSPVGDISADINAATFTLKIAGGEATKIVG